MLNEGKSCGQNVLYVLTQCYRITLRWRCDSEQVDVVSLVYLTTHVMNQSRSLHHLCKCPHTFILCCYYSKILRVPDQNGVSQA